jgi:uncharacterized protein (DUF983 family)
MHGKCPRCREGYMFKHSVFGFKFAEMHERCPKCGLHYEVEKGFYWGAMYISYAFSVAIFVTAFFATKILMDEPSLKNYIINTLTPIILLVPVSFRASRVLMLHLFGGVDYDENAALKRENNTSEISA